MKIKIIVNILQVIGLAVILGLFIKQSMTTSKENQDLIIKLASYEQACNERFLGVNNTNNQKINDKENKL